MDLSTYHLSFQLYLPNHLFPNPRSPYIPANPRFSSPLLQLFPPLGSMSFHFCSILQNPLYQSPLWSFQLESISVLLYLTFIGRRNSDPDAHLTSVVASCVILGKFHHFPQLFLLLSVEHKPPSCLWDVARIIFFLPRTIFSSDLLGWLILQDSA